jgi:hypothetical protein
MQRNWDHFITSIPMNIFFIYATSRFINQSFSYFALFGIKEKTVALTS